MNSKWAVFLVLALVILLVLYVASVGVGARERRSQEPGARPAGRPVSVSLNAPWVQNLRDRLTARLKPEDLRLVGGAPGCRLDGAQWTVPVDGECEFEIAPGERTRALRLKLEQGLSVEFRLEQENALDVEGALSGVGTASDHYDVYRSEEPATLTVETCRIEVDDPSPGAAPAGEALCRIALE